MSRRSREFQSPTITPLNSDKAWAAGIIDGEGTIHIRRQSNCKTRPNWTLAVSVTNTDLRMLYRLKERWGGGIGLHNRDGSSRPKHWQITYGWTLCSSNARPFLEDILPYLVCKHAQAEIGLLFLTTITTKKGFGVKLSDETLEERRRMYESVYDLNHSLKPGLAVSEEGK